MVAEGVFRVLHCRVPTCHAAQHWEGLALPARCGLGPMGDGLASGQAREKRCTQLLSSLSIDD
jgi:hypothetical protein